MSLLMLFIQDPKVLIHKEDEKQIQGLVLDNKTFHPFLYFPAVFMEAIPRQIFDRSLGPKKKKTHVAAGFRH